MGKTLRMAQFYPITHPAFQRSLERSYLFLSQLLKRVGDIDVTITRNQLLLDERPITGHPQVLQNLSGELFRRRLKRLHFSQSATLQDFHALFRVLTTEPHELHQKGGAEQALARAGARGIWANDMQFSATQISAWEEEQAADDSEPEALETGDDEATNLDQLMDEPREQHPELHRLLEKLITVLDDVDRFRRVLAKIVRYCRQADEADDHAPSAIALQILSRLTYQFGDADEQYTLLIQGVRSIATPDVVDIEIGRIIRALGRRWEDHANALLPIGPAVIPFLFHALAEAESRKARERLIATLHKFGDDIREPARALLGDARWFVVRNAVQLLGGLGDEALADDLVPLLRHEHPRVRYAAREALRRLGGATAQAALIRATEHGDDNDRRHAVDQLAYFPASDVLPTILNLVDKAPIAVAEEALRVLSELDPPDILPFLERLMTPRRKLLGARRQEALRRVAAELICLRLPETWDLLRQYASDPDAEVRRWVARGVDIMKRQRRPGLAGA
ncbi:MAG: hypothetical protein D6761_00740 [Candidatus Dadabacteria bacterium]|nr:MAG: hypothetical protein D6761_00740 [Candidatus Dadabacteria bacterium]